MPIPVAALLAAAAVATFAVYEVKKEKFPPLNPSDPRVKPQTPPIQNVQGLPRTTGYDSPTPPVSIQIGTTAGGNPIASVSPVSAMGTPLIVNPVQSQGLAIPQAHALHDYLKANGTGATDGLYPLVTAFQHAHNSDGNAIAMVGRLGETGAYDLPTSAALAVYTGDPIAPSGVLSPVVPAQAPSLSDLIPIPGLFSSPPAIGISLPSFTLPPDGTTNGPAALAGSNLYAYLKKNSPKRGSSPTANSANDSQLRTFVLTFQRAVNTDRLFPGPASPIGGAAQLVKSKLDEDGIYGPKTADALSVVTFEKVYP